MMTDSLLDQTIAAIFRTSYRYGHFCTLCTVGSNPSCVLTLCCGSSCTLWPLGSSKSKVSFDKTFTGKWKRWQSISLASQSLSFWSYCVRLGFDYVAIYMESDVDWTVKWLYKPVHIPWTAVRCVKRSGKYLELEFEGLSQPLRVREAVFEEYRRYLPPVPPTLIE